MEDLRRRPSGTASGDLAGTYPSPTLLQASQAFAFTGDITPSTITSDQNDYNPTGLSTATRLRLATDAARSVTGLQGGSDGRLAVLSNVGSFPLTLVNESASSSVSNRFSLGGSNYTLAPGQSCALVYDNTSFRWRPSQTINAQFSNYAATTDPTMNDDAGDGYSVGSLWVNTTGKRTYRCVVATVGAAIWIEATTSARVFSPARNAPDEYGMASKFLYHSGGVIAASEIQYTRVWLTAGIVIVSMRTFIDAGGSAARNVRMGIYEQTTKTDASGVPTNRVAQTASTVTTGLGPSLMTVALLGSYTVTESGYYWLAIIADSVVLSFAVSNTFRAGFLPIRRESGAGSTLPASAGALTNPQSAVVYCAAVE